MEDKVISTGFIKRKTRKEMDPLKRVMTFRQTTCFAGLLFLLITASACVSMVVPPELRSKVNRAVLFGDIVRDPGRYNGELVVLGGVIISATNRQEGTEVEILQKPLLRTDEPVDADETGGRFIGFYPGYLETAVYEKGRKVTVVGEVNGKVERPIGEVIYGYPVIRARKIHLWPEIKEDPYRYSPYWYDPFYYDPWGPYGPGYPYPYYPYPYRPYWP
ncbi:MAG: Slp family lipoprotein [bacterium]